MSLPTLQPGAPIERPLSIIEYYHASIGSSGRTLETPRNAIGVLEGEAGVGFGDATWQRALDAACAANPGTRLRMLGDSWRCRWRNDGPPARLRVLEYTDWDGTSGAGAAFITATPLSLREGPTVELILVRSSPRGALVILRSLHAVMDGSGGLHLLQEIFRSLRGEAPLGSNAGFSDAELMRAVAPPRSTSRHIPTDWLTGAPQGEEPGDEWRRLRLHASGRNLLPRVAAIMAEYAHRRSARPALIAVPVDLRRHLPGLRSTANFSSMLLVPLSPGEGAEHFRKRLGAMLEGRMEAHLPRVLDLFKLLPLAGLDRLLSRTPRNYRKRRPMETALISNLGRIDSALYSGAGFRLTALYGVPLGGSVFSSIVSVDGRIEMMINLPKLLASNGRFDEFLEFLQRRLAETEV